MQEIIPTIFDVLGARRGIAPTIFCLMLFLIHGLPCYANVKLPTLFGDNMVLQRARPVPVWGTAEPGERVAVQFLGQSASAVADSSGHWRVNLAPLQAGGPHELKVTGKNTLVFRDVMVGDVWLCSGQSNMELTVGASNRAEQTMKQANNKMVRLFKASRSMTAEPGTETYGSWAVSAPGTVENFSATGYFFGSEMNKTLNVPIGLIDCSFSGSPIDRWISRTSLEKIFNYKWQYEKWDRMVKRYPQSKREYAARLIDWREMRDNLKRFGIHPFRPPKPPAPPNIMGQPSSLYNGMIAAIIPFAIEGVIWHQGEADVYQASKYKVLFPALIKDWRARWLEGDFPFYFVQLHNYGERTSTVQKSRIAELREAQESALTLSHTGMVVTIDLGGPDNSIHFTNKEDVGHRLAMAVLANEYGQKVQAYGPIFESAHVEGGKIRLRFKNCENGLKTSDGQFIKGFFIAGSDQRYVWGNAIVDGNTVVVASTQVPHPVSVRYGWADNPECNLINGAGLPAAPFRTDSQR